VSEATVFPSMVLSTTGTPANGVLTA
jgi:hypothetical protein